MAEETVVVEKVEVTKEAAETKGVSKTDALRDLSKELGINAFEPKEIKEKFNEFTKWQESQKSEQEKLQEQLETLNKEKGLFTQKEQDYQTKIQALGLGFPSDKLDEVLALAKVNTKEGETIADGLKVVKEKYGSIFATNTNIGLQHNDLKGDKLNIPRTEQEKYADSSPRMRAYNNRK